MDAADHMAVLLYRNEVEMHAAAASTIRNADSSADPAALATPGPQSEAGPQTTAPALPRWDCNDGDTWHKRQRVRCSLTDCIQEHYGQQCLMVFANLVMCMRLFWLC